MKTGRNLIQTGLLCLLMLQAFTGGAQPVTQIAGGWGYGLFLKSDGSLWAMGRNVFGQLGDGTYNTNALYGTNQPEQIVASNVTAVATGAGHSLFLKSDGSLWAMGWNEYGQLGDGTYYNTNRPEQIVASNVIAIAAGGEQSLFLKSDGSLWAMGDNSLGQLGDGTSGLNNNTNRPEQIVASNVTAIASGRFHSLFVKSDGSLWAMGWNGIGQLGDGTYGAYPLYGTNQPEQIVASNVIAIAAGDEHSLFLKSGGSLWAMGDNSHGQLGNGTYGVQPYFASNQPEQIVASNVNTIAAGDEHSLFRKNDGSLWVMGNNEYGELGDGTYGAYPMYGANQPEQIVANNTAAVAGGIGFSLFLKSDGSLWGMGDNFYGQLCDGTYNDFTNRPEQILGPYNQIQTTGQLLGGTNLQLSFVGVANTNYALDRSSSLSPANWVPQATNPAGSFGALVFTNPPDTTTNNFWRIRSVP